MSSQLKISVMILMTMLFSSHAFGYCPSQMVSYWKLDETSGTAFQDTSDNNLGGSCESCPTPVAGRINSGQQFTNNTISIPANPAFDWAADDSFSIEVWMQRSGPVSGDEVLVSRSENGGNLQWWVGIAASGRAFARLIATDGSGDSAHVAGDANLANGAWHHITFVRDGATSENKLFVDGVLVRTSATINYAAGFESPEAPIEIGSLNGANFFNGIADEVAIYKRTLSDSEISQHYNDGTIGLQAGYCSPDTDIRIMPLGDSVTRGSGSTNINGYRRQLFQSLGDSGGDGIQDYYVDFVGSIVDGVEDFDNDHQGSSGREAAVLKDGVATFLDDDHNPADVVLLHIGTNDLMLLYDTPPADVNAAIATIIQDVGSILDNIWVARPNASVVLSRIILRGDSDNDPNDYTRLFNTALQAMADTRIGNGDRLIVVDQESALNYPDDLSDLVHPNDAGYAKMADVWYTGLNKFLPPTNEMAPQIVSKAVTAAYVGVPYTYQLEAAGSPTPEYTFAVTPPAGMTIVNGLISWTPDSEGTVDVSVRANNDLGQHEQAFQIEVINAPPNEAPVITGQSDLKIDVDTPLEITLEHLTATDPDNAYPNDFTLVVADGDNYSRNENTITPESGFTGELTVPVTVNDGINDSAVFNTTVYVGVDNVKPQITGQVEITRPQGTPIDITIEDLIVTDPDSSPSEMTVTVYDGDNYTKDGTQVTPSASLTGPLTIPVSVNDGSNESDKYDLQINITGNGNSGGGNSDGGGSSGGCFIGAITAD